MVHSNPTCPQPRSRPKMAVRCRLEILAKPDYTPRRRTSIKFARNACFPPFHTQDRSGEYLLRSHSGDFTLQETHVPIPNTTVKLLGPTIVPKGVKIGHRRELSITSPLPRRRAASSSSVESCDIVKEAGHSDGHRPTGTPCFRIWQPV